MFAKKLLKYGGSGSITFSLHACSTICSDGRVWVIAQKRNNFLKPIRFNFYQKKITHFITVNILYLKIIVGYELIPYLKKRFSTSFLKSFYVSV